MELSQIRYFTTLAGVLNFTRAAEACNVTQPALTKAIQKLEDELGGPLFHRERNFTQLTELGRSLLPLLEQAQAATRAAKEQAAAFRRRASSPLRLGIDSSLSPTLLTPLLAELSRAVAELELSLRQEVSGLLREGLLAGEVDAAILVDDGRMPDRLHRWPLFEEGLVLLAAPGHRLAAQERVPVGALAGETLLMRDVAGCPLRTALEAMCAAAAVTPRIRPSASSHEQIAEMVKASLGLTLAGVRYPVSPPLVARPLAEPAADRRIELATAAGRAHGPTLGLFLKLVRAVSWTAQPAGSAAA